MYRAKASRLFVAILNSDRDPIGPIQFKTTRLSNISTVYQRAAFR